VQKILALSDLTFLFNSLTASLGMQSFKKVCSKELHKVENQVNTELAFKKLQN
jgi:hypothetical protein